METGTDKVCRRCGTLNNEKNLMCIRCGESLDIPDDKKYAIFQGKMRSEKLLGFLYLVLFTIYLYITIFYIGTWINDKILEFSHSYVFEFYSNSTLTYVVLQTVFTIILFVINYLATTIIFDTIFSKSFIKREKVNSLCMFIYFYTTISVTFITYYKFNLNYDIMLEYLISFIALFPYIKRKIFRRSI